MTDPWIKERDNGGSDRSLLLFLVAHTGTTLTSVLPAINHLYIPCTVYTVRFPGRSPQSWGQSWSAADFVDSMADGLEAILRDETGHRAAVSVGQCSGAWLLLSALSRVPLAAERVHRLLVISQGPFSKFEVDANARLSVSEAVDRYLDPKKTDPSLIELFAPLVHSDIQAMSTLTAPKPLSIPIDVVYDPRDRHAATVQDHDWVHHTTDLVRFRAVSDLGHLPMTESPQKFAEVLKDLCWDQG